MYSVETAIEKFKEILQGKTSWVSLKGSQFVEHLAIFVSWCLRSAQWTVERAKQEFFISTALNRSSIIAHAEDREYLPRKPYPSSGVLSITNDGDVTVTLPSGSEFITEREIPITITDAIIIAAGETQTVNAEQKEYKEFMKSIGDDLIFREILIDAETTPLVLSFEVYVDINDGNGPIKWEYSRLLQNAYPESKVYDEFYASTDQIGIRFGNGTFGLVPPSGSTITIKEWLTNGDIYLASGQEVFPFGDLLDANGDSAILGVTVSDAFQGGVPGEDIEGIRASLHYWPIFNDQLVWDDDYIFFTKRRFPQIAWMNVWGEKEAEVQAGSASLDYVNTIFVSAYAVDGEDIFSEVMAELEEKALKTNRRFQWIPPSPVTFTLSVSGKVEKSRNLSEIENAIFSAFIKDYGPNSYDRKVVVLIKEIYSLIDSFGFFEKTGEYFEVTPSGTTTAARLESFVSIDIDNTTIALEYL